MKIHEYQAKDLLRAAGVPVLAGRVARTPEEAAAAFTALGTPVWLDAADPLDPARRVRRLMVAQDTGGAIRGVVRGDVFWGTGTEAGERAGRMRSSGRFWLLLPTSLAARIGARD